MKITMIEQEFKARYPHCSMGLPAEYTLKNITAFAVFCVDCIFDNDKNASGKHCDEFIFYDMPRNTTGIYLVERKKNTCHDFEKVRIQLQGGAEFITNFVEADLALDTYTHKFKPVLVSRGIKSSHRSPLHEKKISLLGKEERIVHVPSKKALPPISR